MFDRMPTAWGRAATALLVLGCLGLVTACGGGAPEKHVQPPMVRNFSPQLSPMDLNTLEQTPTFTDPGLTVSTDPRYPGEIVIFFQSETTLDPASIFIGGRKELGLDLSALQVLRFIPGTGNVELPLFDVIVEKDRIRCIPNDINGSAAGLLVQGQYSIGVFDNLKNTEGKRLVQGPVFHSFTVGATDGVSPFVVTTTPGDQEIGVGAGAPPPQPPAGVGSVANVRTAIFGPTTPDVVARFNEPVDSTTVNLNNISVQYNPPGSTTPLNIAPAPGFPKLKSVSDGATLPSNGHEIIWRADPIFGGFPFGTIVKVTLVGLDDTGSGPANPEPIQDLSGNGMEDSYSFSFQTIGIPDLPQNPFPEYAIWWSASDRVGVIDAVNQPQRGDQFFTVAVLGLPNPYPLGIERNAIPNYSDTVSTAQNLPGFEPTELSVDGRTGAGAPCHTWVYAMSPNSGQLVVINSRTSVPVAVINTPTPGGISNQTGGGQAANVLVVTNSSANTLTVFDLSNTAPGATFLNGPIFVQSVRPTGNTPKAVSISLSPTGLWNRDPGFGGPPTPLIMYVDFTDGVVNTATLSSEGPVKQFSLGPNSAPNDVSMTPCFGLNPILFAAISQGGLPGEGKVAYYIAGPGCQTGTTTPARPDSLVGDVSGLDGPAGLDEVLAMGNGAFFVVAESGSQGNAVTTLGLETGAVNLPRILNRYDQVGANPVAVAHRAAWGNPCIDVIGGLFCINHPFCYYGIPNVETQQSLPPIPDLSLATAQDLYICARGAGQVTVVNMVNGLRDFYSPISIPSVRFVASPATQ